LSGWTKEQKCFCVQAHACVKRRKAGATEVMVRLLMRPSEGRKSAGKPGSVHWRKPGGDHSSRRFIAETLKRPTCGQTGGQPSHALVLLRMGFAMPPQSPEMR